MKPVNTTASAATDKMAAFVRLWVAQFGNTPHDWARRNDPGSSYYLFADFVNDERTSLLTVEIALGKFEEPPAFNRFKSAYFQTRGVAGGHESVRCGTCHGVRFLYAVTGLGNRRDGQRGTVITGPGHRVIPVENAAVTTIRCTCNPGGEDDTAKDRRFATPYRQRAEQHADECHAAFKRGDVQTVVADDRIPPGPETNSIEREILEAAI